MRRKRYESALALAQDMRFRPEIALAHLGLAETLHAGFPSESAAAREHLDACLPELDAMHMRPGAPAALQALRRPHGPGIRARAHLTPTTSPPAKPTILRLLAQGQRNRDIAAELVISPATVTRHVSNILAKTGLQNRTELANYA
ncbi:MAG: helix-turn-helix transcriptional regulator, partial [Dehalococcoidia bacterium]|nr:helix-turn-helix transcriptional regulator [Dehalococcoidia bacterium]